MKIAHHNAATGAVEVRDATSQEADALNVHWGGAKAASKPFVFVGASNTTTDYVSQAVNYAHRVSAALGLTCQNSAVSGQSSTKMLENIQSQVFAHNPAAVCVLIGTNDAAKAVEAGGTPSVSEVVATYISNMRSFITQVRGAGIKLLVLSPNLSQVPETNVYLMAMGEALRTLCIERSVAFLDLTALMAYHQSLGGSTFDDWFIPSDLDKYHLGPVGHGHEFDMIMKSQIRAA